VTAACSAGAGGGVGADATGAGVGVATAGSDGAGATGAGVGAAAAGSDGIGAGAGDGVATTAAGATSAGEDCGAAACGAFPDPSCVVFPAFMSGTPPLAPSACAAAALGVAEGSVERPPFCVPPEISPTHPSGASAVNNPSSGTAAVKPRAAILPKLFLFMPVGTARLPNPDRYDCARPRPDVGRLRTDKRF
jgi:hypothetical protein